VLAPLHGVFRWNLPGFDRIPGQNSVRTVSSLCMRLTSCVRVDSSFCQREMMVRRLAEEVYVPTRADTAVIAEGAADRSINPLRVLH
jgi:hypothetical protein